MSISVDEVIAKIAIRRNNVRQWREKLTGTLVSEEALLKDEEQFLDGLLDLLDPSEIVSVDGIEPRCDICHLAQQPDDDWNGETGCHINCELFMASSVSDD